MLELDLCDWILRTEIVLKNMAVSLLEHKKTSVQLVDTLDQMIGLIVAFVAS